jgi:glycosyltransferase involved in cell wall biosynthesis
VKTTQVSVIIPIYNGSRFVEETIRSVVNQNFEDWELILVDDGSTDNTREIIESFKSTKIRCFSKPNSGVSDSRNYGAKYATGEYFAFIDADDIWKPAKMSESVDFIKNHPVHLVHSYMEVIDASSKPTGEILQGKEGWMLNSLLLWDGCNIPSPSSILVSKDAYEKVGGFDTNFSTAADQDFFFRIANNYEIGMIKSPLGQYRVHGQNMHLNIQQMESDHISVYLKAKELGLFHSKKFERECFSRLYKIIAGSWWKEGNNKIRAIKFIFKSIFKSPKIVTEYFS